MPHKLKVDNIYTHPLFYRAFNWFKLIGITGAVQVFVQIIGFVCGVLVIRTLSTQEYALYTLGNTLLGAMLILANSGLSIGVMAQGGKVWQNQTKLGEVLATGLALRKKFALITLIFITPILIYLLRKNEASWLMTVLIILSLIPAFFSRLSGIILEVILKLKQDIVPLQKNQFAINVGRLILLGFSVFLFPYAFVAILAAGLPQIWGNLNLRNIVSKHVDLQLAPSPVVKKDIMTNVNRILPQSIYSCLSGQVTIWLISIFGSVTALAQIGALGRIGAVLSLFTIVFDTLLVPRFARLEANFKILIKRYVQIQILIFIIFSLIVLIVYLFSDEILWVLGPNYTHLNKEIVLVVIANALMVFSGIIYGLYSQRGWILNPILSILFNVSALLLGISLTDVSTLRGVLILNIIIWSILVVINSLYGFIKILKLRKVQS